MRDITISLDGTTGSKVVALISISGDEEITECDSANGYWRTTDLHVHIEQTIAEGDTVTVRATMTGTDTGGVAGRAPTGRAFRCWTVEILGFRDGRIISDWLGFFVQLGIVDNPWT